MGTQSREGDYQLSFPHPCLGKVLHFGSDADGVLGEILLSKYAERLFPNIGTAPRHYVSAGATSFNDKSWREALADGYLFFDVCGGPFDHHKRHDQDARPGQSCVELVFDFLQSHDLLNAEELWAWKPIVDRVHKNDTTGVRAPLDMFNTMTNMSRVLGLGCEEKLYAYAKLTLEMTFRANLQMLTSSRKEYEGKARRIRRYLPGGREIRVSFITSDDEQVLQYCTTDFSDQPDVLVQRQKRGTTQIHAFQHRGREKENLELVHTELVTSEKRKQGATSPERIWFWHEESGRILNGSLKSPGATPTLLEPDEIEAALFQGLAKAEEARKRVTLK